MTPRQILSLQKKIATIKGELAYEKRKFGGIHDGRGIRYMPTQYYVKLGDWVGGLAYTKWFHKNFPDDSGFPEFLFEWAVILFKNNLLIEAERMIFRTFCRNTYVLDEYWGRVIIPLGKYEGSNLEVPEYVKYFKHKCGQKGFEDFDKWLDEVMKSEKFVNRCKSYIDSSVQLEIDHDREKRHYLVKYQSQLEKDY
jgi:hypothetical protein